MLKVHKYFVYILASQRNGTLYVGVTNGLFKRGWQHALKYNEGSFTDRYNVKKLVYFESYQWIQQAIDREKELKGWNRQWKLKLIEKNNPDWSDLMKDWA